MFFASRSHLPTHPRTHTPSFHHHPFFLSSPPLETCHRCLSGTQCPVLRPCQAPCLPGNDEANGPVQAAQPIRAGEKCSVPEHAVIPQYSWLSTALPPALVRTHTMHANTYGSIFVAIHTHAHTHTLTHAHTHTHTHTHAHAHTHSHSHSYTCTYTNTCTYTYTCMPRQPPVEVHGRGPCGN